MSITATALKRSSITIRPVFYFSTHQYPYYPGTGSASERGLDKGEGTTLNIPLSEGTSASVHREAFAEALKAIEKAFPPDLIIISRDSIRGEVIHWAG